MKKKIYANYGVLNHEHKVVYAVGIVTTTYDPLVVDIPAELIIGKNIIEEVLLNLGGSTYTLNEALSATQDKPVLRWYQDGKCRTIPLEIVRYN